VLKLRKVAAAAPCDRPLTVGANSNTRASITERKSPRRRKSQEKTTLLSRRRPASRQQKTVKRRVEENCRRYFSLQQVKAFKIFKFFVCCSSVFNMFSILKLPIKCTKTLFKVKIRSFTCWLCTKK